MLHLAFIPEGPSQGVIVHLNFPYSAVPACHLCEGIYNHCTLNRLIGERTQRVSPRWRNDHTFLQYIPTKYFSVDQDLTWELAPAGRFLRGLFVTYLCKQAGSLGHSGIQRVKICCHAIIPQRLSPTSVVACGFLRIYVFFSQHQYVY